MSDDQAQCLLVGYYYLQTRENGRDTDDIQDLMDGFA